MSRSEPILIAMYTYKGGVGKTTIAINLVETLAQLEKRTLLVDCDPQCNATSFLLGCAEDGDDDESDDQEYIDSEEEEESSAEVDEQQASDQIRIQPTVKLMSDKLNHTVQQHKYEAVEDTNMQNRYETTIYQHLCDAMQDKITPSGLAVKQVHENLWVLPGDVRLIELETEFRDALDLRGMFYIHRLAGFRRMIDSIAKNPELGIEYVVVDLGPSAGAMNQVIILNCDYILPPLRADRFSLCSMDGFLNKLVPNWLKFLEKYKREIRRTIVDKKERDKYAKFGSPPKILPFLMNGYAVYSSSKSSKAMTKHCSIWSQTMIDFLNGRRDGTDDIDSKVLSPAVKALMVKDGEGKNFVNFCRDLCSVMEFSHKIRIPIVTMKPSDAYDRKGLGVLDIKGSAEYARPRYRLLAKFIGQLP